MAIHKFDTEGNAEGATMGGSKVTKIVVAVVLALIVVVAVSVLIWFFTSGPGSRSVTSVSSVTSVTTSVTLSTPSSDSSDPCPIGTKQRNCLLNPDDTTTCEVCCPGGEEGRDGTPACLL
eukprot:GFUD01009674.1.p1 GENE.GFUD01009674.1~~GFUD01009674.1.p1  ORF type:complete len:120 (-),score=28.82 GFUD01009674.1:66-425(-)